ncbi:MAG: hypothetical protein PHC51_09935 [bacterium]|nr:hypothetical protein [bacterium]
MEHKSKLEQRERVVREFMQIGDEALDCSNVVVRGIVLNQISRDLRHSICQSEQFLQREYLLQQKLEEYD